MSGNNINYDEFGYPVIYHGGKAEAVTPSDTDDIETGILFVGVGGNLNVVPYAGEDAVLFKNIPDGSFFPIKVRKVMSTNTTATDIVIIR